MLVYAVLIAWLESYARILCWWASKPRNNSSNLLSRYSSSDWILFCLHCIWMRVDASLHFCQRISDHVNTCASTTCHARLPVRVMAITFSIPALLSMFDRNFDAISAALSTSGGALSTASASNDTARMKRWMIIACVGMNVMVNNWRYGQAVCVSSRKKITNEFGSD